MTHRTFVEAFNKELVTQLSEPMDAQELQDAEKCLQFDFKIWIAL